MFGATLRYSLSPASLDMHTVAVTQYPHHSNAQEGKTCTEGIIGLNVAFGT